MPCAYRYNFLGYNFLGLHNLLTSHLTQAIIGKCLLMSHIFASPHCYGMLEY